MHELTLYHRPFCPYSGKVLAYIKENDILLSMKNVSESSEIQKELEAIGGKTQVPCLVIDGKPLYESDEIIQWLDDHLGKE